MRGKWLTVAAICTLGVMGGGAVVAAAGTDITSPETISAHGTQTRARYIDEGKPGEGPGDVSMFVESLSDASGAVIGSLRVTCTAQIGGWGMCEGVFTIDGRGQIVGSTLVAPKATGVDVPITGGSGDFANVRGEDHIEFVSPTEEHHTLDLLP